MSTRNLAGGALVAVGLIVASLAWSGFSMSRTILNPDRSEEIARHLYQDPFVKEFLEERVAQALAEQVPLELGVANRDLKAAAANAMESANVEDTFVEALGAIHRQLLGLDPKPGDSLTVASPSLAEAVRYDLVKEVPGIGGSLGALDTFAIDLPVDSLPDMGSWRSKMATGVNVLAGLAVIMVAVAFVITNNRPGVLRRVGFWAIGAAAFWLVLAVVIPVAAPVFLPERAALMGGFWGVAAEGMRTPSIVAVGSGVVAVVLSFLWSGTAKVLGGSALSGAKAQRQSAPYIPPTPHGAPNRPVAPTPSSVYGGVGSYAPPSGAPVVPQVPTAPPMGNASSPTQVYPGFVAPTPGLAPPEPPSPGGNGGATPEEPRWVEGQGYVDQ